MPLKGETRVKKLVTVSATSTPVTVAREEAVKNGENPRSNLAQILCIRYSVTFGTKSVLALFDSGSKVNAVHPTFSKELSLSIRPIDVKAQKIDGTMLNIYKIVVAAFLVTDKAM